MDCPFHRRCPTLKRTRVSVQSDLILAGSTRRRFKETLKPMQGHRLIWINVPMAEEGKMKVYCPRAKMPDFGFIRRAATGLAALIVSQRQMQPIHAVSRERKTARSWYAFLVLAATLICFTDAVGADRINRGRALLAQHCAGCHAIGRTGPSPLPAAPAFRAISDRLDLDELFERMREGLSSGHREMPSFRFDREDARAIRSYLSSIQQ